MQQDSSGKEGGDRAAAAVSHPSPRRRRSLSPVGEHGDGQTQHGSIERGDAASRMKQEVPAVQRPMNRSDHQDIFGKRSSAAEGLVDATLPKPAKGRGANGDTGVTANNLDLDFASVERASARMKRNALVKPAVVDEAKQLQSPRAHTAAAAHATAAAASAGARAAGKTLISDDEGRALQRLMVGPREEADGFTQGHVKAPSTKGGAAEEHIGEGAINAIDAKAMDRLARQNDELRKLAEVQRRELEVPSLLSPSFCAACMLPLALMYATSHKMHHLLAERGLIALVLIFCVVWWLCLSVCLSVGLSVCLSICLSVCLSNYLSVCLSVCLPVCLSICLYVCLSVPCLCSRLGAMCRGGNAGVAMSQQGRVQKQQQRLELHRMLSMLCQTPGSAASRSGECAGISMRLPRCRLVARWR